MSPIDFFIVRIRNVSRPIYHHSSFIIILRFRYQHNKIVSQASMLYVRSPFMFANCGCACWAAQLFDSLTTHIRLRY